MTLFIAKAEHKDIQNLPEAFEDLHTKYEVSIKIAGEDMTVTDFDGLAIQGVLIQGCIQCNLKKEQTYLFLVSDIWSIAGQCYWDTISVREFCLRNKLEHVPVLHKAVSLTELKLLTTEAILKYAKYVAATNPLRKGLVFKQIDGQASFQAISN